MKVKVTVHGYGIAGQELGPYEREYKVRGLKEGLYIMENVDGTLYLLESDVEPEFYYLRIDAIEEERIVLYSPSDNSTYRIKYDDITCLCTRYHVDDGAEPSYVLTFTK